MHGPDWWRDGRAVVRPFGYRHDDPIVRRIDDRDLFVGNVHAAAETARRLVGAGSLLIHCSHGVSRSATLAAIAILTEDRPFRDALSAVQSARPPAQPYPALHELAVAYLAKQWE
jgi:atypical dual specificity phosphatase